MKIKINVRERGAIGIPSWKTIQVDEEGEVLDQVIAYTQSHDLELFECNIPYGEKGEE